MKFFQILFALFSFIFKWITDFRNYLYEKGYLRSFSFDSKVILVGNLAMGGTGKTPMIEYLIRLLQGKFQLATLSRGYGRKSKGFILADKESTSELLGDEPFQYFKKYGTNISVAVGESRMEAIPKILFERPETQVILMDDGYQHRSVRPQFSILLTDYSRPFYKDYVLPSGYLRESRKGAARANVIVVSKCPAEISAKEKEEIAQNIRKYSDKQSAIFFTGIKYLNIRPVYGFFSKLDLEKTKEIQVILFSGIAKPKLLEKYISQQFDLREHYRFSDHHFYTLRDLIVLRDALDNLKSENKLLLTTEKDYVKLLKADFQKIIDNLPVFYLPIEVYFLEKEDEFKNLVLNVVNL